MSCDVTPLPHAPGTGGGTGTPPGGTNFTRDDVAELNRTDNESQALFIGNIPLGVQLVGAMREDDLILEMSGRIEAVLGLNIRPVTPLG